MVRIIPSSSAYGVFISQLIRYARACSLYECFILRARRLSIELHKQGYLVERLKSSFRKFYGRYGDLIQQYEVSLSRMLNDILTVDQIQWLPNRSDFPPISWPWYRAWPSPNYKWFPWSICNGCGMPAGNFLDLVWIPLGTFLIFLQSDLKMVYPSFIAEVSFCIARGCQFSKWHFTLPL